MISHSRKVSPLDEQLALLFQQLSLRGSVPSFPLHSLAHATLHNPHLLMIGSMPTTQIAIYSSHENQISEPFRKGYSSTTHSMGMEWGKIRTETCVEGDGRKVKRRKLRDAQQKRRPARQPMLGVEGHLFSRRGFGLN